MNYMDKVAEMLGVQLGEEFNIDINPNVLSDKYYLAKEGLFMVGDFRPMVDVLHSLLNGEYKVVKIPILDNVERKYLTSVIKPFRNRIKYFYKCCYDANHDYEAIIAMCTGYGLLEFPAFKKNTMYKGMKAGKDYTLEELGL